MSFKIGITGALGTGKTTVAHMLSELSCAPIISIENLVKKSVEVGSYTLDYLIGSFGKEILNKDKTLNIDTLKDILDNSSVCRNRANAILFHGLARELFAEIN